MTKLFSFRKIIKIPGKSFDDLSLDEVASMIEADSSLSSEGNEYFDSAALDVFLHNAPLARSDLRQIRDELLLGIYRPRQGSPIKDIDTEFLCSFAVRLRNGEWRSKSENPGQGTTS